MLPRVAVHLGEAEQKFTLAKLFKPLDLEKMFISPTRFVCHYRGKHDSIVSGLVTTITKFSYITHDTRELVISSLTVSTQRYAMLPIIS